MSPAFSPLPERILSGRSRQEVGVPRTSPSVSTNIDTIRDRAKAKEPGQGTPKPRNIAEEIQAILAKPVRPRSEAGAIQTRKDFTSVAKSEIFPAMQEVDRVLRKCGMGSEITSTKIFRSIRSCMARLLFRRRFAWVRYAYFDSGRGNTPSISFACSFGDHPRTTIVKLTIKYHGYGQVSVVRYWRSRRFVEFRDEHIALMPVSQVTRSFVESLLVDLVRDLVAHSDALPAEINGAGDLSGSQGRVKAEVWHREATC